MDPIDLWNSVTAFQLETSQLEGIASLLEWDDRTYLPPAGAGYRAEQIALLSGLVHRRRTDPALGTWLAELSGTELVAQSTEQRAASILKLKKDFDRHIRLPVDFVQAMAKATALGQQAWEAARRNDDWQLFQPHLKTIVGLKRQEAQLLRQSGSDYDALIDQYEEGATSEQLTALFAPLQSALVPLVKACGDSRIKPLGDAFRRTVALPQQHSASRWIAEKIGYSFERGRLDETSHPFCTTLGPDDCRILTRYQIDYFPSGFYSTLHEAGHGMYEQGLPKDWYGLPAGAAASLGIHESQSRLWENFIGRSEPFWRFALPELNRMMPGLWQGVTPAQAFADANAVQPSLIRVEADEATYNLHIMIRFELEQELIGGVLEVDDAPQAWNDRYERYLGIRPQTYADGILQDVHWSAGLFGYFPTYTLGNMYAAVMMQAMERQLGGLDQMQAGGDFQPILDWLRSRIHQYGRCLQPESLVRSATGMPLSSEPFIEYLSQKLQHVYDIRR